MSFCWDLASCVLGLISRVLVLRRWDLVLHCVVFFDLVDGVCLFVGICRVLRLICNERYGGVQILGFLETVLTVIWLLVGLLGDLQFLVDGV